MNDKDKNYPAQQNIPMDDQITVSGREVLDAANTAAILRRANMHTSTERTLELAATLYAIERFRTTRLPHNVPIAPIYVDMANTLLERKDLLQHLIAALVEEV